MVEPMVMTMVMSANTNCTVDGQGMCVVHRGQDDDNNIDPSIAQPPLIQINFNSSIA